MPYYKIGQITKRLKTDQSTCVAELFYDAEEHELTVVFQQRGTYKYFDVPVEEAQNFMQAGLKGTYFNLYIRPFYAYERIA